MTCVICKHGETAPGHANVVLHRGETAVLIKGVVAQVCRNCGEHYLSEDVADRVLSLAEKAVERGAELEVLRFAA